MRRAKLALACFPTSMGIDPHAINLRAVIIIMLFSLIALTGCTEERPFMTTMVAQIFPTPTITPTFLPPSGYTLTPTHTHTPTPTDTPTPTNTPTDTPEPTETSTPRPVPTPVPVIAPQPETNSLPSSPSVPLNTNTEQNTAGNAPILPPGTPPPTGVNNVFVPNPRPFNTAAPDLLTNVETEPYQSGTASVYADFFQGMSTSTGEPFDHNSWTAAHERLALGTIVRVTNLRDGRWVTVRINDRIPVGQPHIIDMTKAAAGALGNTNGIIPVRIDIVSWP